jgi:ubiquinone/menaquinone biosynthesis C-methylase UbiE
LATKYSGLTAAEYERDRVGKKWNAEHDAIEQLLEGVPRGSTVLDIPVGTGRLLPYFKRRDFEISGVDISADMLAQARSAAQSSGASVRFTQADVRSAPFEDESFDLVVCIRFLNLVDEPGLELVLSELARLSRRRLLVGVRYVSSLAEFRGTPHDFARLAARPIWVVRWAFHSLFGYRKVAKAHRQAFVLHAIRKLGLTIGALTHVERRWDSADYVLLLLEKP